MCVVCVCVYVCVCVHACVYVCVCACVCLSTIFSLCPDKWSTYTLREKSNFNSEVFKRHLRGKINVSDLGCIEICCLGGFIIWWCGWILYVPVHQDKVDWYWKSLLKVDNDDDITLRGDLNFQIIEGAYTIIKVGNTNPIPI